MRGQLSCFLEKTNSFSKGHPILYISISELVIMNNLRVSTIYTISKILWCIAMGLSIDPMVFV